MRHGVPLAAATALTLAVAACSGGGSSEKETNPGAGSSGGSAITVIAHDSFDFPEELITQFEKDTGVDVTIQQLGSGGEIANQLVLTKDAPLGDVVYGVDNTVSYRLSGEGVIADAGIESQNADLDFKGEPGLVPVDQGDVCVNLDKTWFTDKGLEQPKTFEDLAKPEYKDLLVALNPASSTPGMAFMLATIEAFGDDGWLSYWGTLRDNGTKIADGWSDAFSVDYSAGEGAGPYPMMVSYGSSPAYSVTDDGSESTTTALPETCYRQVEYAGVLTGTKNEDAAKKFVDYLLTPDVQEAISEETYMFPVNPDARAPADLEKFGELTDDAHTLPADEVAKNAETWLRQWQDEVVG